MSTHSQLYGGSIALRRSKCKASYRAELNAPEPPPSPAALEGTGLHKCVEECLNNNISSEKLIGREFDFDDGHFQLTQELHDDLLAPAMQYIDQFLEATFEGPQVGTKTEMRVRHPTLDVFGTIDLAFRSGSTLAIGDLKFGRFPVSVENNKQLQTYAALMWRDPEFFDLFDKRMHACLGTPITKTVTLFLVQPLNPVPLQTKTFDVEILEKWALEMEATVTDILENKDHPFQAGEHCKWCRAAVTCPAQKAQALRALSEDLVDPPIDPDELGEVLRMADQVSAWAKNVRAAAFNELLKGRRVTGHKLVNKRKRRDWVNDVAAADYLRSLGVNDPYDRKLLSPAQAEKAVQKLGHSPKDLAVHIEAKGSGFSLVPEADPRPAVDRAHDVTASVLNLPKL